MSGTHVHLGFVETQIPRSVAPFPPILVTSLCDNLLKSPPAPPLLCYEMFGKCPLISEVPLSFVEPRGRCGSWGTVSQMEGWTASFHSQMFI